MPINFFVADNIRNAAKLRNSVDLYENIHSFLDQNKDRFSQSIELLSELDPYSDKVFEEREMRVLLKICNTIENDILDGRIQQSPRNIIDHGEIINFAKLLKQNVQQALQTNQKLVAIGE